MSYKIEATIFDENYIIDNWDEPDEFMRRNLYFWKYYLRSYVAVEFREITNKETDITHIKYLKGSDVIFDFNFKENESIETLLMKALEKLK